MSLHLVCFQFVCVLPFPGDFRTFFSVFLTLVLCFLTFMLCIAPLLGLTVRRKGNVYVVHVCLTFRFFYFLMSYVCFTVWLCSIVRFGCEKSKLYFCTHVWVWLREVEP